MKSAQMNDTQLAAFLSSGHAEANKLIRAGGVNAGVLELLEQDHATIMEHLDRICEGKEKNLAKLRPAFLTLQMMLVAHSLAEERAVYAKLKQQDKTFKLALEAGGDHEMISRLLEDLSGLDLAPDQWFTLARSLRDLVQQHVETEESEIFEQVRENFDQAQQKIMAAEMRAEVNRILMTVA